MRTTWLDPLAPSRVPETQRTQANPARQESLLEDEPEAPTSPAKPLKKQLWPKSLPEQAQAVRALLAASPQALTPAELAKTFQRGQPARVTDLLETLVSLGHARAVGIGRMFDLNENV